MQNIIRVDMSNLAVTKESEPDEYQLLGGRGLTSRIVSREVAPNCSPFDAESKIVFAPGLLTGSLAPCSGRLSVGAKSPLTGGIKESNVGGTAGQVMARASIKALIIEGKPSGKERYVLEISSTSVKLRPANDLAFKTNYEVGEFVASEYGDKTPYICVGPGAEHLLAVATVAVGDMEGRPTRHAGRGGMGAVLASKGIKAIVFTGTGRQKLPQDDQGFKDVVKEFAVDLVNTKKALTRFGTAVLVNVISENGAMPVNNFRHGTFDDVDRISGETLAKNCHDRGGKTGHGCYAGCVIKCSNIYHDISGNYLTSALEYETIVLLGANCGLRDLDQIAELDFICDNYGLDTMETGSALAVSMEGGMLEFGDFQGMKEMLHEMGRGTITGKLLGQGATVVGKTLGVGRIPAVKGQAMAAYDPRALKGTGTTYATSPMGGDHTAGNCLPGRTGLDDHKPEGQVEASLDAQILTVLCDNLGLCIFVGPVGSSLPFFTRLVSCYTGNRFTGEELMSLGKNILREEASFNEKAGISKYQNDVPKFFRTEELHSGLVFDVDSRELSAIFE
ncbi:aldehyde ferredoxin oxidoreductase C-terminal domain-containing protein [Desulforhopalus singaporensis]|uniref:Aldehyde:ferredoxin oxidoreductase n=1 Tax=Desulforhopalus singaporensis TaxID=91360 RepID=A0A1H0T7T4_9BACT|nr:aldehyde ferredoxin oxidoreductase C-terminal domain-containing protein [Desulforhopalus singaporensis]SDP49905.1 aldehyde:ferredoxin oxidoreductase [Desulforhopalus singaporensis]